MKLAISNQRINRGTLSWQTHTQIIFKPNFIVFATNDVSAAANLRINGVTTKRLSKKLQSDMDFMISWCSVVVTRDTSPSHKQETTLAQGFTLI